MARARGWERGGGCMALNFFFSPAGSWEKVVWRFCAPLVFDFLSLSAFAVYACSARLCLLVFQFFFFRACGAHLE
jgi:hypothetical protein